MKILRSRNAGLSLITGTTDVAPAFPKAIQKENFIEKNFGYVACELHSSNSEGQLSELEDMFHAHAG